MKQSILIDSSVHWRKYYPADFGPLEDDHAAKTKFGTVRHLRQDILLATPVYVELQSEKLHKQLLVTRVEICGRGKAHRRIKKKDSSPMFTQTSNSLAYLAFQNELNYSNPGVLTLTFGP
ncbi:hypothetical protein NPIL_675681 [Nephila pilipes]|uniref:Uncharacterized protein n=1 Tax=Nephila pilipes TaxID=299642 RepID=A0A8X6MW22_NEPPI|nr:hypothetical protein NPIL_675681 [Nephila pilipes]